MKERTLDLEKNVHMVQWSQQKTHSHGMEGSGQVAGSGPVMKQRLSQGPLVCPHLGPGQKAMVITCILTSCTWKWFMGAENGSLRGVRSPGFGFLAVTNCSSLLTNCHLNLVKGDWIR